MVATKAIQQRLPSTKCALYLLGGGVWVVIKSLCVCVCFLLWHFMSKEEALLGKRKKAIEWEWERTSEKGISSNSTSSTYSLIEDLKQHLLTLNDLPQQQFVFSHLFLYFSLCLFFFVCLTKLSMVSLRCRHTTPHQSWWFFIYLPFFFLFVVSFFFKSWHTFILSIKQLLGRKICMFVPICPD